MSKTNSAAIYFAWTVDGLTDAQNTQTNNAPIVPFIPAASYVPDSSYTQDTTYSANTALIPGTSYTTSSSLFPNESVTVIEPEIADNSSTADSSAITDSINASNTTGTTDSTNTDNLSNGVDTAGTTDKVGTADSGTASDTGTSDTTGTTDSNNASDSTDTLDSSSSTDAGSSDAGSTDAGSTDAGSPDAGSTDAGSTDAGNVPDTSVTTDIYANLRSLVFGRTGDYLVHSAESVFVADQDSDQILHLNAITGAELNRYDLDHRLPNKLAYSESENALFVSFKEAGVIARINIDTCEAIYHSSGSVVLEMAIYGTRLLYTYSNHIDKFQLHSWDFNGDSISLTGAEGDLLKLSPTTNEVFTATSDESYGTSGRVSRMEILPYTYHLSRIQTITDIGGNVSDIAVSNDGERIAIATADDFPLTHPDEHLYSIFDYSATDLQTRNIRRAIRGIPKSVDFSIIDDLLATVGNSTVVNFYEPQSEYSSYHEFLDISVCDLNDPEIESVKFSGDGGSVFTKISCGHYNEKSVLFFFAPPNAPNPELIAAAPKQTTYVAPAATTANPTQSGTYGPYGTVGSYYAMSDRSLYVADQVFDQIVHVDPATNSELAHFKLSARPTKIDYLESSNALYAALDSKATLVKIALDTGTQTEISTTYPPLFLTTHNSRVYYTTISYVNVGFLPGYGLYSVGDDDAPVYHGVVKGDLIAINPITNEVSAYASDYSTGSLYQYSFDANNEVVQSQVTLNVGGGNDLAISPDGEQLVSVRYYGNNDSGSIYEYEASDPSTVNGAWIAQNGARSAAFSPAGDQLAVLSSKRIIVYDTDLQLPIVTHVIDPDICQPETAFFSGRKVRYSRDGGTLFVDIDCQTGTDKLIFIKAPPPGTVPSTEPAPTGTYLYGQN